MSPDLPNPSIKSFLPNKTCSVDQRGQASFAVVAVLILVLAGATVMISNEVESQGRRSAQDRIALDRMLQCADMAAGELEETAYQAAFTSCLELKAMNSTLLQMSFEQALATSLGHSYPNRRAGFEVGVPGSDLHLDFLRLTRDGASISPSPQGTLSWQGEGLPAYFTVGGNYTLSVRDENSQITLEREIDRRVYLPIPLLLDRMGAFERAVSGGKNSLENMVRYELASLAQWRALQGYGSSAGAGQFGTSSLLTEEDSRRAFGLALVLEEIECFGRADPVSLSQVLAQFPTPMTSDELMLMLEEGAMVDPADIFLSLYGIGELDTRSLVAQTLYASADFLVLRWLDYLQVIDLAESMERLSTDALVSLNDFLEQALGQDRLAECTQEWMAGRLLEAGMLDQSYRWIHEGEVDTEVIIPRMEFPMRGWDGQEIILELAGCHALDFPSLDVLSSERWKDFVSDYRQGTFELAQLMRSFVQGVAFALAQGAGLPPIELTLDPRDDLSMADELQLALRKGIDGGGEWFVQAIDSVSQSFVCMDPMGEALMGFMRAEWMSIFELEQGVDRALEGLASHLLHEQLEGAPSFDTYLLESYASILAYQLKYDAGLGVRSEAEEGFRSQVDQCTSIFSQAFGNMTLEGIPRLLQEVLARLARGLVQLVPGVEGAISEACASMLEDAAVASGLRTDRILVHIPSQSVVLALGQGARSRERLVPKLEMPWLSEPSGLRVEIIDPLGASSSVGGPNLHLVDPGNVSLSAFQSAYRLHFEGEARLTLRCEGELSDALSSSTPCELASTVPMAFDCSLTCSSAWPLQGVSYSPSATLLQDISDIFGRLWDGVLSGFDWLAEAASEAFVLFQDLVSKILSFSTDLIQAISDLFLSLVQGLRDLIDGALGAFIGWLGQVIIGELSATSFALEFGGLRFVFDIGLASLFLGQSKEYLKVTMSTPLLGAQLTVQARFVDIYRQGADLITNISMAGEGWRAECLIDPRMAVMDHLVELRGVFSDCVLELALPVLVAYEKRSFRLSDIPGVGQLLSRIPVPIPGLTASIDAGFEMKYDRPIADHPVINEVEMNPSGLDSGREWAEIYNPTDQAVDMSGWTLLTAHGDQALSSMQGTVLPPRSYQVVRFPTQALDNGGESGYPLGESLALYDEGGRKVDSMPFLTDHYNDIRTWQRSFDASDRWAFKEETRDAANGWLLMDLNDMDRFLRALRDCAARAFSKMNDRYFDLATLAELIKETIIEVVETLLETIARSIVEMSLFVEVALQDYSQSFDGRLRLALVITGEGVRDALLWIGDVIATALSNLLNPGEVAHRGHSLHEVMDDVYIRFGAFGSAGLPKLLSSMAGDERFLFGGMVDVNLATFIAPPKGPRNWTMSFGALFEGVPGAYLRTLYPIDSDQLVDCWVVRATLHSLRPEVREPIDGWGG